MFEEGGTRDIDNIVGGYHEIPLRTLFRTYKSMSGIEKKALDMAKGKTLDVGAASGCHSLELQKRGIDVTAILIG